MPFKPSTAQGISPDYINENMPEAIDRSGDKWSQIMENSFALHTHLGSFLDNEARGTGGLAFDPNFDIAEAFKKLPAEYQSVENTFRFANAENQRHFDQIKDQLDKEYERRQYEAQTGYKGVLAGFAVQMVDPINYFPVGGVAVRGLKSSRSLLHQGAKTALAGGTAATAQELAIHSQQQTAELGESAANIATGTFLSGLFGAALYAKFSKSPNYAKFEKQLEKELEIEDYDDGLGALGDRAQGESVGAAKAPQKSREELLDDNSLVRGKGFAKIKFQDPGLRLAYNESVNARLALQDLADFVPKFKKHLRGEGRPIDVETLTKQDKDYLGKKVVAKNNLFLSYKKRVGKNPNRLTLDDFDEEIVKSLRRGGKSDIPEIAEAAKSFREMYTRWGDEGIDTGVFKDADSIYARRDTYVNQVINKAKVGANPAKFRRVIADILMEDYAKAKRGRKVDILEEAKETLDDRYFLNEARKIETNYMGARSSDLQDGILRFSMPGMTKERKINVDFDTVLGQRFEEFLDNNLEFLARNYNSFMSTRTRMIRRFGKDFIDDSPVTRGSKVAQDIVDEYSDLKDKAINDPKEYRRLSIQEEKTLNDLFAIRDRIFGTYGYSLNPDSWAYRVQRQIKQFNVSTMLGDVTASSIPDVGKVIMEAGLTNFVTKGMRPLLKSLFSKEFRNYLVTNFPEANRLSSALEMVQPGRLGTITDAMDDFGRHTKFERASDIVNQKAITLTGIRHWNAALKQIAGMVINDNMIDALKAVSVGKASTKQLSNLARSGIDSGTAKAIYKQIRTHSKKVNELTMPNIADWDDAVLGEVYISALRKDVDRVIVTPGAATTPLWLSKNGLTLFGQFQSFAFASMQKTLIPMVQDFDAKVAQGLVTMVGLGMVTAAYKRAVRGDEIPELPALIQEGIDRSGSLAWLMDYNNRLERLSQGNLGVSRFLGTNSTNKYYNHNKFATLGPTSGQIDNVMNLLSGVLSGNVNQRTVSAARRLLPLQNAVGFRQTLDLMEDEFNNNFGIPKN